MKPDDEMREAFKNAADEVNDERGASGWRPTWQALGLNYDRTSLFKRGVMKAEEQKEERTPSTPSSGSGGES